MNENFRDVRTQAQFFISRKIRGSDEPLTSETIRDAVGRAIAILGADDVIADAVVADLEGVFATVIGRHQILQSDDGWNPWLKSRKPEIDWRFWERYRQYLKGDKGWAPATLEEMDQVTDSALGLLNDPLKPDAWNRRGMIVGDVQSGKTSNYIGLICKAVDAGYKVIIVLAGFHKSLRSQTQIRLDEGFLGYDRTVGESRNSAGPVGVGILNPSLRADSITTRADDGDFKKAVANNFGIQPGGNPLLFVVKKNASVLKNLISWVESVAGRDHGRPVVRDVPLLMIDDEADQGSVDTQLQVFNEDGTPDLDHNPTAINRLIRRLLILFDQHAYVGYTATPFANIFIHEQGRTQEEGDDLFPKSFILSLPSPSNHIGPARVFGYEADDGTVVAGLPMVRAVEDHAASAQLDERKGWMPPKHDRGHTPRWEGREEIPPSLQRALLSFVLSTAARYARGQRNEHNSMLVHVTRFTAVQKKVAAQLNDALTGLKQRLRYGEGAAETTAIATLQAIWEEDHLPTSAKLLSRKLIRESDINDWAAVRSHLADVLGSIQVREINGFAGEVLDYKVHEQAGLNVIAVGGDKLSRGLTLEGLTTSYFLRASRMYDTLMQMGRWFGYREGYLDLCRLFTTEEMENWFSHIAMASDELRDDFDRMVASGGTPRDFGHRVRSHPTLLVTSAVKMRHGHQIDLTYSGDVSETINFRRDLETVQNNYDAARELVLSVHSARGAPAKVSDRGSSVLWKGVGAEAVLGFLRHYREHEASKRVKTKLLADYIEAEVLHHRLTSWTVLLASGDGRPYSIGPVEVRLVERDWHETTTAPKDTLREHNHYRIRRLLNPADEYSDLHEDEYAAALEETVEEWRRNPRSRHNPEVDRAMPRVPMGPPIREARPETRGLLLIYPLDPGYGADLRVVPEASHLPVIGFGISFPTVDSEPASKVRYTVGNVYFEQEVAGAAAP